MRNFQDTFETRKRRFISAFSICMTVSLRLQVPCWNHLITKYHHILYDRTIFLKTLWQSIEEVYRYQLLITSTSELFFFALQIIIILQVNVTIFGQSFIVLNLELTIWKLSYYLRQRCFYLLVNIHSHWFGTEHLETATYFFSFISSKFRFWDSNSLMVKPFFKGAHI